MSDAYDTVVIGSGSGGFTVAIGLTGLGRRVAIIERAHVGGDCTNVGCIPSKTLIHDASTRGTGTHTAELLQAVRDKRTHLRDEETKQLRHVEHLTLLFGHARFAGPRRLAVTDADGAMRDVTGTHIVIATGSRPRVVSIPGLPSERTLTNETLFEASRVPDHLVIVGAGAVAMEMAFAFRNLGSAVTLVVRGDRVLARLATAASDVLHASLVAHGISVQYQARVQTYDEASQTLHMVAAGVPVTVARVDRVLLAIGREPNVGDLDLARAGVRYHTEDGIPTDAYGRTNVPHIFAVGDVTPDGTTTHAANAQGRRVVQRIAFPLLPAVGEPPLYPTAIFSDPEVAAVGLTPEQVARRYHPGVVRRIRVELKDVDRGYTDDVRRGFVMVDAMCLTGRILGATIVAPHAGDMISLFTLAMTRRITLYTLSRLVFPYPTLSEAIKRVADTYLRETLPHLRSEAAMYVRYRLAPVPGQRRQTAALRTTP